MEVEFIQTCIGNRTPLLMHYEDTNCRRAGKEIKKAIINAGHFSKFDLFDDYAVKVERMKYKNELYAIVTYSAINHIFKIS